MKIKFGFSILLVSYLMLGMEQDGMTIAGMKKDDTTMAVVKNFEATLPFAGRIIAFKIPWRRWQNGYQLPEAAPNIRYGYIYGDSSFLWKTPEEKEYYHGLQPLERTELLGGYYIHLTTRILAKDPLFVRLATLQEVLKMRVAIDTGKARLRALRTLERDIIDGNLEILGYDNPILDMTYNDQVPRSPKLTDSWKQLKK